MGPEYTVLDNAWMYHIDRQRGNETHCDGCGEDYGSRWPHGIMLAVITDRSGSEHGHAHNDETCIAQAVESIENYYLNDEEE